MSDVYSSTLHTVGRNTEFYSFYRKKYGFFSKKLKIELPYAPAIQLLDIYPKKIEIRILKRCLHFHLNYSSVRKPRHENNLMCLLTDKRTNNMCIHKWNVIELKSKEILSYRTNSSGAERQMLHVSNYMRSSK